MRGQETIKALLNGAIMRSKDIDYEYIQMIDGKVVDRHGELVDCSLNTLVNIEFEAIIPLPKHKALLLLLSGKSVKAINNGNTYFWDNGELKVKSNGWVVFSSDMITKLEKDIDNDFLVEVKE